MYPATICTNMGVANRAVHGTYTFVVALFQNMDLTQNIHVNALLLTVVHLDYILCSDVAEAEWKYSAKKKLIAFSECRVRSYRGHPFLRQFNVDQWHRHHTKYES